MLPRSHELQPWNDAPLYTFGAGAVPGASGALAGSSPWVGVNPPGMAAVCLGVARGALDAFATLASTKTPTRRDTLLRDDPIVQTMFGRAEAKLRAARSYLYATVADLWRAVQGVGDDTRHERTVSGLPADGQAMVRLASIHAAETAVEVVQSLWRAAGTSAIPVGCPLDRRLRDVMVASQNVAINPMHTTTAGRLLLERGT
jgi:indole-3-acetate monooxygenase